MKLKIFLILLILFTIYILTIDKAQAAGLSLGVSPPLIQITAQPPAEIKAPIALQNLSDESVELDILFKPFTAPQNENGEINYLSGTQAAIFNKIQILDEDKPIKNLMLAAKQDKKLFLKIGIPENETDSDYYFSIQFIQHPFGAGFISKPIIVNNNLNYSQILGGIGINVLLSLGKQNAKGYLEEFSTALFLGKGPVPFTVKIKNTGSHFVTPQGIIVIKNIFGQLVGKIDLMPINILKDSTRSIKPVWNESFLLGVYTANLNLSLSEKGPTLTKAVSFFAMPAKAIIALLASLFIVLLIYNRVKKN